MVVIILMATWYTACWLNIAFIGSTLLMVYLLPLISLKTKVIISEIGNGVKATS
jgi:hypothetical protein